LFQRFGQLRIGDLEIRRLFRELLNQPGIFDSDHGLIGKGLKQANLPVCKRHDFKSPQMNDPDRTPLS
jgi:hypothetical protein